jgi:hypothetical protein
MVIHVQTTQSYKPKDGNLHNQRASCKNGRLTDWNAGLDCDFCGECVKMCEDFIPNIGDKRTGSCITTTHHLTLFFFTREFLTKSNIAIFFHTLYFSLFHQLKIQPKGRHFYRIEVIEVESQVVLNILTEHDFQDALKNCRSDGNDAYVRKGVISKVMVASRHQVIF